MSKNKERPEIFIGWVHKGRKNFEVIPESKVESLLKKLFFEKGVHPGAVFMSKMTIVKWLSPQFHRGRNDVNIYKFYEQLAEINDPNCYYKEPNLKSTPRKSETKYGYVSPDGRYFHCEYFGHSTLEREIVGKLEEVSNPQQYLYDKGWLCIYHDPFHNGTYAVQMGYRKKMTDEQLKTLERLGIPSHSRGFQDCLLGRGLV